jgi:hypothetical protein
MEFQDVNFDQHLTYMGTTCPEIVYRHERLAQIGGKLVRAYGVNRDFFGAGDNATGLTFAAGLHAEAADGRGKSGGRVAREQHLADAFTRTLMGPVF